MSVNRNRTWLAIATMTLLLIGTSAAIWLRSWRFSIALLSLSLALLFLSGVLASFQKATKRNVQNYKRVHHGGNQFTQIDQSFDIETGASDLPSQLGAACYLAGGASLVAAIVFHLLQPIAWGWYFLTIPVMILLGSVAFFVAMISHGGEV